MTQLANRIADNRPKGDDDDDAIFGKLVSREMRSITNAAAKRTAKLRIHQILYEAASSATTSEPQSPYPHPQQFSYCGQPYGLASQPFQRAFHRAATSCLPYQGSFSRATTSNLPNQGSFSQATTSSLPDQGSFSQATTSSLPDQGSFSQATTSSLPDQGSFSHQTVNNAQDEAETNNQLPSPSCSVTGETSSISSAFTT